MSTKALASMFALTLTLSTVAFVVGVAIEEDQAHPEST